jgi:Ca2+-binding EF-hand superfamily protein
MPDEMFARLDTNKDGSLTPDELAKRGERFAQFAQRHFQHADTNGDGAISKDEVLAETDKRFARMDKNGDGVLTQDELKGQHRHGRPGEQGKSGR